jgi:serine/threonine protein kinase
MDSLKDIDPLALPIGTKLGSYEVVSPLGKGGMGSVYVVERDGRRFAAKLTRKKLSDLSDAERERTEARVRREISILWAVSHPNLVRIHAADRWPEMSGYLYLVTDLIEGEPLHLWQAKAKPSLRQLAELFIALSDGVQTLHRAYFIHRDLKTDNVIVDGAGRPVIIDFGIARQRDSYTLTSTTSIIGTSDHLSPEFCRYLLEGTAANGEKYVYRPTDDLHAVGFMLYECLCGSPPFEVDGEENEWTLLQDIARRSPPSPRALNPAVPTSLDGIAMRLLEKDPEKRFQSGLELQMALAEALQAADETWNAPFTPPPYRSFRERGTAGGPKALSASGALVSASGSVEVQSVSAADRSPPPVASLAVSDVAPNAPEPRLVDPPVAAKPVKKESAPVRFSAEEAPAFVSVEAPAAKAPAPVAAEPPLPTAVREGLRAVKAADSKVSSTRYLIVGIGALLLLLVGITSLRSRTDQERDLLKGYEQERSRELADSRAGLQPVQTAATAIPPAEASPASASANRSPTNGGPMAPAIRVSEESTHTRPPAHHTRGTPPAVSPSSAPSAEVAPRSLLRSAAMHGASTSPAGPQALGVERGQMFQARLSVPLSPDALGPVTAVVSSDVLVNGALAVPRGSTLVGAATSASGGRIQIRWDTLNLKGKGSLPIEALAYGADQLPGLPFRQAEDSSTRSPAKDAALATGAQVLSRMLGDGVGGDLGRGAVDAAALSARNSGETERAPVVIPKGPSLYVFVTKAF